MLACKPSTISMDPSIKLCTDSVELISYDPGLYRRLVGKTMFLTITRPDIIYAVNKLCQFISSLKQSHLKAAYSIIWKGLLAKNYSTVLILTCLSKPLQTQIGDLVQILDVLHQAFVYFLDNHWSPESLRSRRLSLILMQS